MLSAIGLPLGQLVLRPAAGDDFSGGCVQDVVLIVRILSTDVEDVGSVLRTGEPDDPVPA